MTSHSEQFRSRFLHVLGFIDANLDQALTVQVLSSVAAYSPCHFQRQFSSLFGIGVYQYVQLARMKRAAFGLAFRPERSVTDIAFDSGYDSLEAFSRAFKKLVGQTPTAFRAQPHWEAWHGTYQPLLEIRNEHMNTPNQHTQVRIVDFPHTPVAALAHRGQPARIGDTVRQFIAWRKEHKLPPRVSATFNIIHNNPAEVGPENYHMDLCAATEIDIAPNAYGVVRQVIPAGRCAVLRHVGSDDTLGDAVMQLYANWLPHSGEETRDYPLFFQRVSFFPDVPEDEMIVDIFLPLKN